MEVKPGYKQTEVGVIPEDWEVSTAWQIAVDITDGIREAPCHAIGSASMADVRWSIRCRRMLIWTMQSITSHALSKQLSHATK